MSSRSASSPIVTPWAPISAVWLDGALIALAVVSALVNALWLYRDLRHDDAFITFQYAANLASGDGLVFNAGERVLGTSSPLYALLLAVVYAVVGDGLAHAAVVIGSFALAAQALLIERLLRPAGRALSMTVAVLLLCGFAGSQPYLSLETNLCAALVLGAALAFERKRQITCGALLGLAFLCRNDTVLLVPMLTAGWWFRDRELPIRLLVVALLVVLPWLVGATWYFGSFLPQTLSAKRGVTPVMTYLTHYLEHIPMAPWRSLFGGLASTTIILFSTLLAAIGCGRLYREARGMLWLYAFGVLLLAIYARIGPPAGQHWHMYPAVLMFRVACVVGVFTVVEHVVARWVYGKGGRMAAVVLMLALSAGVAVRAKPVADTIVGSLWYGKRHARYGAVIEWLSTRVDRRRTLLATEIGTLGYLGGRRMIDACGLINETNDYHRDPSAANMAALVARYQPDIVLVSSRQRGAHLEQVSSYRIIKVFEPDPWSTILIRIPEVLVDPSSFEQLVRDVEAGRRTR